MLRSLQALRGPLTGRLVGGARGVSTGLSSRATSASSPCAAISAGLRRSGGVDEHDAPLSVMAHAVVGAGGIRASDDHLDLRSIQPVVARKGKKILGRGIGSGRGKTAGRGHKGQKARSGNGKPRRGFEGGQTPLYRRLPKVGFTNNAFKREYSELNIDTLSGLIDAGRIDANSTITMKTLLDVRAVHGVKKDGVRLLGRGTLEHKVDIEVSRASKSAITAVEKAGGKITEVYYNSLGLRALLKPEWFAKRGRPLPRPALPPPKLMKYYVAPEGRGYLRNSKIADEFVASKMYEETTLIPAEMARQVELE